MARCRYSDRDSTGNSYRGMGTSFSRPSRLRFVAPPAVIVATAVRMDQATGQHRRTSLRHSVRVRTLRGRPGPDAQKLPHGAELFGPVWTGERQRLSRAARRARYCRAIVTRDDPQATRPAPRHRGHSRASATLHRGNTIRSTHLRAHSRPDPHTARDARGPRAPAPTDSAQVCRARCQHGARPTRAAAVSRAYGGRGHNNQGRNT